MTFDPMREQLIKLAGKLQKDDIKLIIGGGYGLLLKREYLAKNETPTRFELPEARSTNDIDTFLKTEIITNGAKLDIIKAALNELGFKPVAPYFQFAVPIDDKNPELKVKIDFLAALPSTNEEKQLVKINKPRIRAKDSHKMHGYLTEEAVTLEENLIELIVTDENNSIDVFLPHPFTYLVLKLFALRDRLEDEEKDFGAYHSFDIYRIIAMMTEKEWEQAVSVRDKFADEPKIQEARSIVNELFSSTDSVGILRLRQHIRSVETELDDENISEMVEDLKELFPNV